MEMETSWLYASAISGELPAVRNITTGFHLDPRSTNELVQTALSCTDDADRYWETVEVLEYRGTEEVFAVVKSLCSSAQASERVLCANILGELGTRIGEFTHESVDLLLRLLDDPDSGVAEAAVLSLGRRRAGEAAEPLLRFIHHPDADVRRAVASALGDIQYSVLAPETTDALLQALMVLSSDEDQDVREAATSALAFSEGNRDDVIEALHRRVQDEDAEIRAIALLGLAENHDPRVIDLIKDELARDSDFVYDDLLDAISRTGDHSFPPILCELKEQGVGGMFMDEALEACSQQ